MNAALRVAARGTLDPGWVGHPGSTLIYPLAFLLRAWHVLFEHGRLFAWRDPGLNRLFDTQPETFYLLGRLVSAAYGVGSVVLTGLIARRLVPNATSLIAPLLLTTTAIAVAYGQIVRTDTAGMCWALATVWLVLRGIERPGRRDWIFAALTLGLAVASRYFFAFLAPVYLLGLWLRSRPSRGAVDGATGSRPGRWWLLGFAGLALAAATFALTSPYVLLDIPRTIASFRGEASTVHPGADGLSPVGNLVWYVTTVLPANLGPLVLGAAIAGGALAVRRTPRPALVLLAFGAGYLVCVSAFTLHWDRYVIPLVPIAGTFVAVFVDEVVAATRRAAARRSTGDGSGPDRVRARLPSLVAAILAVALLAPAFVGVVVADRLAASPSTRVLATEWMKSKLPPGTAIAQEMYGAYLKGSTFRSTASFSLSDRTLASYQADGWQYLVVSSDIRERFDADRYPTQNAFYANLAATAQLVATFAPDADHAGPTIEVFRLPLPGSSRGTVAARPPLPAAP